jgi:hypothetical protein
MGDRRQGAGAKEAGGRRQETGGRSQEQERPEVRAGLQLRYGLLLGLIQTRMERFVAEKCRGHSILKAKSKRDRPGR